MRENKFRICSTNIQEKYESDDFTTTYVSTYILY